MVSRYRVRILTAFVAAFMISAEAAAQHLVELRGADTRYRYADWNYTFSNAVTVDVFYVGVPGSNELNIGGGYSFRIRKLTLSPLVYAVAGREDHQRGVKLALLVVYQSEKWKLSSFLAHFAPVSGTVERYQVLDTFDMTRLFGKRWEGGLSGGIFHSGGAWSPQIGPLTKLNDRYGSWGLSYRFGPQRELRLTRVLTF